MQDRWRARFDHSAFMPLTKAQTAHLRRLQEKRYRSEKGLFVVEGSKVVDELIETNYPLAEVYATADWPVPAGLQAPLTRVSPEEMARLSHYPAPSNILAVGKIPATQTPVSRELDRGLTLALDAVQDPGNVGTLLRIADWFGFDRVLLSPECADLFSQKVINASMGSFARVRSFRGRLEELLTDATVPVIGCDLTGESVHEFVPPLSAVLVIGSEGRGLSHAVGRCITQRVTIPRIGRAESLNAAVAGGIICATFRRPPAGLR
jgi:RNA methyltransferase, TrmH family